ncbi:MAG: NfeD family protein [Holophagales bacterium]|nr:MAG: NfeD family protein [Holophagales bacterium]
MPFWLWLILGLVLLAGELLTPGGFFIVFFGVGALVVGLLGLAGVVMPLWLQGVAFSAVSVLALLLFRKPLLGRFSPPPARKVDPLVGEEAVTLEEIGAGRLGKVELRGTPWNARATNGRALAKGVRVRVERVEGLTVFVGRAE